MALQLALGKLGHLAALAVLVVVLFGVPSHAIGISYTNLPTNCDYNVAQKIARFQLELITVFVSNLSTTANAHRIGIVQTCAYNALALYLPEALPSFVLPRELAFFKCDHKHNCTHQAETAVAFASYRCLRAVWWYNRAALALIDAFFAGLGYNCSYKAHDASCPEGVGNLVARSVIEWVRHDGSNLFGNHRSGIDHVPYSDWTNYYPVNDFMNATHFDPDDCEYLRSINHWQPLAVPQADGSIYYQKFLTPQFSSVKPMVLSSPGEFRPRGPPLYGSNANEEFERIVELMIPYQQNLTDYTKVVVDYWANDVQQITGMWFRYAVEAACRKRLDFERTVKLFYLVGVALFDSTVAVWDSKRYYDFVRPITAIRCLLRDKEFLGWLGPDMGFGRIKGSMFLPYQSLNVVTPPFAEYVAAHSGISMAVATVLKYFFHSDHWLGEYVAYSPGASRIEPRIAAGHPGFIANVTDVPNTGPYTKGYVPAERIELVWKTWTEAAEQSGISRLYGGIHFITGHLDGLHLGSQVGKAVFHRVKSLWYNRKEYCLPLVKGLMKIFPTTGYRSGMDHEYEHDYGHGNGHDNGHGYGHDDGHDNGHDYNSDP